ncbi:hypothetical protein ABEB36_014653 [Hypothenemus hampei]|uniref:PHD-type domain-containing protein n=1 Tax=Hypothenemus hampei TaxID=57062 RepID=A0ABD1E2F1_HYPHA
MTPLIHEEDVNARPTCSNSEQDIGARPTCSAANDSLDEFVDSSKNQNEVETMTISQIPFDITLNQTINKTLGSLTDQSINMTVQTPEHNLWNSLVINNSISPFLAWPHSPKRKGKRQLERTPYALTSSKYQKIFEAKRFVQLQKEEEKENKKQEREKKKKEKELQKIKKTEGINKRIKNEKKAKTVVVPKKHKNPVCYVCTSSIEGPQIQCDVCGKRFHKICIAATHQMHLPDHHDGDGFLCHFCYVEESEDDAMDELSDDDVDKLNNNYLSKTGGVGLNLIGGNHLIFLDLHWNPQVERQAEDRINRLGQTKPIYIYKFIAINTIEERIKIIQETKMKTKNKEEYEEGQEEDLKEELNTVEQLQNLNSDDDDDTSSCKKKLIINESTPFLLEIWAVSHAPTDYERWRKEFKPYTVKWQTHYEPYVDVKSNVTPYDERFLGFGWNKLSHIMKLEAQRYKFIVLSDVFVIYGPHKTSRHNEKF